MLKRVEDVQLYIPGTVTAKEMGRCEVYGRMVNDGTAWDGCLCKFFGVCGAGFWLGVSGGDDVLLYDNITLRGRGALIISFLYCGLFGFSGSRALLVQTSQRHCCTQN